MEPVCEDIIGSNLAASLALVTLQTGPTPKYSYHCIVDTAAPFRAGRRYPRSVAGILIPALQRRRCDSLTL